MYSAPDIDSPFEIVKIVISTNGKKDIYDIVKTSSYDAL